MTTKLRSISLAASLSIVMILTANSAYAFNSILNNFNDFYGTDGTRIDSCGTCHINFNGGGARNPYGVDLENNGLDFTAIDAIDSDGDGMSNGDEAMAQFMPGWSCDNFMEAQNAPADLVDYVDPNNPGCLAVNQPPVAEANGPYTGTVNIPVMFSSAGSVDPDGSIVAYLWDFGDGNTSMNPNPNHTYMTVGTFDVNLTVTDDAGASASDSTTATITEQPMNEPDINLNPNSLDFGPVEVSTMETRTSAVENTGTMMLNVTGITRCVGTSMEYTWSPDTFSVDPGASQTLTVTYAPVDEGPDPGCLEIASNDPNENPAILNLNGSGFVMQPGMLDLDIARFHVTKRVKLKNMGDMQTVKIKLLVENNGTVEGMADATVVGIQNGVEVYNETMPVSDPVEDGRTMVKFPEFTPTEMGDIEWTVTINDQDPDIDEATASTKVRQ